MCPSTGERVSDFQHTTTFVREADGRTYNLLVQVSAPLPQPVVSIRVDINNRDMHAPLDPPDLDRVYSYADSVMPDWFFGLFGGDR